MSHHKYEDDDYMSQAVLAKCRDKRPGLMSSSEKKQYRAQERVKHLNQQNRTKPRMVLETEKRNEGLNNALDQTNKGFALLQKMGYKPGMTMGKSGGGRAEPVPIQFRAGRSGLGHESAVNRKRNATAMHQQERAKKRNRMREERQKKFQSRQSERFFDKLATRDLYKSQRVCEQLDSQKGITEPAEKFFWPENLLPHSAETAEKGRAGFKDDDNDDEESETTKPLTELDESDEDEQEDAGDEEDELFSPTEKLQILTMYLRNKHMYCVWCGTPFTDKQDLKDNCPGDTPEAHDE